MRASLMANQLIVSHVLNQVGAMNTRAPELGIHRVEGAEQRGFVTLHQQVAVPFRVFKLYLIGVAARISKVS